MIRVVIADDHEIVREGLKQILEDDGGIEVVAEVSDGTEVLGCLEKNKCDIILLDVSMPGKNGLEALADIKINFPKLPVLFLSMYPESQYAFRVFKAGAAGYLSKSNASDELLKAIYKISSGGRYITEELAEMIAERISNGDDSMGEHEKLTDREFQVMCLIGRGLSVKDIATELGLSSKTISTYRERILRKMTVNSNAEIIKYCLQNELVS